MSRLFSAASKATHFKELRTYYFHNCVYGRVYKDRALQRAGQRHGPDPRVRASTTSWSWSATR